MSAVPPVLVLVSSDQDPHGIEKAARRVADAADLACTVRTPAQHAVAARGRTEAVEIVLVSARAAPALATVPGQRPLVLAERPDDPRLLHAALALRAEAVLPVHDELELLQRVRLLRDQASERERPGARLVSLRGAVGGAGASSLAAALALESAASRSTTLIDGDPHGSLELLLGDPWSRAGEQAGAAGWNRLVDLEGHADPELMRGLLPAEGLLRLIGHGRERDRIDPGPRLPAVVESASRSAEMVIVDLPRAAVFSAPGPHEEILLVPCTAPGIEAAARLVSAEEPRDGHEPRRWVVARCARAGLHPEEVAAMLGMPLAGVVRADRRLDEHVALQLGAAATRRAAYATAARAVLRSLTEVRRDA